MSTDRLPPPMKSISTGRGEPVVLVPGGLTGWLSWERHAERLSADHRVLRVQLLNVDYGLQDIPIPPGYSVSFETEALAKAVDLSGINEAHFVAWSFGAEVTLDYALNNPQRVKTLTLIEPPAIWVLRSRGPLSNDLIEDQKKIRTLGPKDVTEDQLSWFCHFAGFVPRSEDPRTLPQWPTWVRHRQSLRHGDAVYRHEDDIKRVRGFTRPVLLFKGDDSSAFLHGIVDILGEEFPNATVKQLPGGHAPHLASMEPFLASLSDFMKPA